MADDSGRNSPGVLLLLLLLLLLLMPLLLLLPTTACALLSKGPAPNAAPPLPR